MPNRRHFLQGLSAVPLLGNVAKSAPTMVKRDYFAELEQDYPRLKENILAAMGNVDTGRLLDTRFLDLDANPEAGTAAPELLPIVTEM